MKKTLIIGMVLALPLTFAGCADIPDEPWGFEATGGDRRYENYDEALEGDLSVSLASLRGDMGPVRAIDLAPEATFAWRDGFGLHNVTVEGTTPTGALVMAITTFDDRVLDQELGTTVTYHPLEATGDEPYFDMIGCSGEDGVIDFDIPAEEVEVEIQPSANHPDAVSIRFVATFRSEHGVQETVGAFDLRIPGEPSGPTAPTAP